MFSVEVHLFDFSEDIYDENLEIHVFEKLREIEKFPSLEILFAQVRRDIVKTKKYFMRKKVKTLWKNLDSKSREILAQRALEKVSGLSVFINAQNIYIYAPKYDEIDFVQNLCSNFSDKNYFFPRIIKREMKFFPAKFSDLTPGKWGILEPEITTETFPKNEDLVFVPAVAANIAGNRLGNGGGFYDRFLQTPSPPYQVESAIKTMCVLPEFAVFDEIPIEEHDEMVGEVLVV